MESKTQISLLPSGGFLSLPGERLLFFKRQHWIVILPLVVSVFLIVLASIIISYIVFVTVFSQFFFFLTFLLFALVGTVLFLTKVLTEWYFHLYVITTKKIIELSYRPLCSDTINDVLLSQVRCTEVDVRTKGFIHELFDIGDIAVTFDRPTHQEEFIFCDIKNPREMGLFLMNALDFIMRDVNNSVYYKKQTKKGKTFRFTDEIIPYEGEVIHHGSAN